MALAKTLHAACLQLCSTDNIEENISNIESILNKHKGQDFDLILLPENATLLSRDSEIKCQAAQPAAYLKTFDSLAGIAKEHQAWLVAGSLLIQDKEDSKKMYNHCPVFSPDGTMVSGYDKIHLFDADLGSESWQESTQTSAGTTPITVTLDKRWQLGLSICYDLRFPELYRFYSQQGCNIMTVPSSFTVPTGEAHWEVLLRARAIENQSFILAAGQSGLHKDGRQTYGHSMIIDPWGTVISKLDSGEGLISAKLSLDLHSELQKRMPVLQHRNF